ncbi:hypothetical protein ACWEC4_20510 [Streptomyces sp. NPDC005055]
MGDRANTPDSSAAAPHTRLTPQNAPQVAAMLQALSTPSRLLEVPPLRGSG